MTVMLRMSGGFRCLRGKLTLAAWGITLLLRASPSPESGGLAVVVYNSRLPESKAVAEHYAQQRDVPVEQVIGFNLPDREEITRAEFKFLLQEPLFDSLVQKHLFKLSPAANEHDGFNGPPRVVEARIRYAVLCFGVPLKIKEDSELQEPGAVRVHPNLRRNQAAVDSELVCLPRLRENLMLCGLVTNSFYGSSALASLQPTNGVLLVGRLDGPTPEIARKLVDQALQAEREGLWGRAYIDARGIKEGGYKVGDEVLLSAAQVCGRMGYDVAVDLSPTTFPPEYPLSHVAIYAGWYDANASGPFLRPVVEFMPGAFAYHLHSFSAATIRSASKHWVGPLLAKGVTATVGSVYEPYLAGTSDVAILLRNLLLQGASFGEAAWTAEFGFSWQTTVVGDPLYRPWRLSLPERREASELKHESLVDWMQAMLADRALGRGVPPTEVIAQLEKLPSTSQSAILTEKLGDIQRLAGKTALAMVTYRNALGLKPSPQQEVRLRFTLANLELAEGKDRAAAQTLITLLADFPDYPAKMTVLKRIQEIATKLGDKSVAEEAERRVQREQAGTNASGLLP